MGRTDKALELFSKEFNCAQSVLFSFEDILHIDKDTLLKITTGFGAGTSRLQLTCGAVNGAVMVLGLLYGRGQQDELNKQEEVYSRVQLFINRFHNRFSSISCFELIDGCNLLTDDGQKRFESERLIERCNECVKTAVEILEEIIQT